MQFGRNAEGHALVSCLAFVRFARSTLESFAAAGKFETGMAHRWDYRPDPWEPPFEPWFKDLASAPDDALVPLTPVARWVATQLPGCTVHHATSTSYGGEPEPVTALREVLQGDPRPLLLVNSEQVLTSGAAGLVYVGDQPLDLLPSRHCSELPAWRQRIRDLNPRGLGAFVNDSRAALESEAARTLAADIGAVLQVDFTAALRTTGRILWEAHAKRHLSKRVVTAGTPPEVSAQRAALRGLLQRPFDLDVTDAWIPLALRAALRSTLLPLPLMEGDLLDAVANIGAGHLLRIHVLHFPGDPPHPLGTVSVQLPGTAPHGREPSATILDGGDVIAILQPSTSSILEGSTTIALAQRRALAADSGDDDDDIGNASSGGPDEDDMCDDYGGGTE